MVPASPERVKTAGATARAAAARAVDAVRSSGQSLDRALAKAEASVPDSERALTRALSYGALRHWWSLDARIAAFLNRPLRSRDSVVAALLVIGALQIDRMRIPAHAAVSETVGAAKLLGRPKLSGLVNAVLRNLLRHPRPDADDEPGDRRQGTPGAQHFDHPDWIIERLACDWPEDFRAILAAGNAKAPMWLRVNARRGSSADWLARFDGDAVTLPGLPQALRLAHAPDVAALHGFADGDVSVQDGAAQLAAPWLLADGGSRLLDLCAAPGGKAAHLLELAGDGATLTAIEASADRAPLVTATLERLGLSATVCVADASDTNKWWDGRAFDRVLLDAPCSASGVIRRHPDIKHLRRPEDLTALAATQARLLAAAWRVLAPGGRLLYVTCSVFAAENEDVVGAFLERTPGAVENKVLPNNNINALMKHRSVGFQVLPGTQDLDGFYYACLEKPHPT